MDQLSLNNIIVEDSTAQQRAVPQLYRRVEGVNFKHNNFFYETNEDNTSVSGNLDLEWKYSETLNKEKQNISQVGVFQDSMKIVYAAGYLLGLIPVTGLLRQEVTRLRFSFLSWKYLYFLVISVPQVIITIICFYSTITKRVSISTMIYACFYASTSISCIHFVKISTKWPNLINKLSNSNIDEYSDSNVILKCKAISVAYIGVSVVNHGLRIMERLSTIKDCYPNSTDVLKLYSYISYKWLFELYFPDNYFLMGFLIPLNIMATMIWYYPDLFIACISMYLTSVIKQVNKKIIASVNRNLPSSYWKRLREDYNNVAGVVRSFDEVFNCLIFSSFANNLFFVCFHIYYLLSNGISISKKLIGGSCSNYSNSHVVGYENTVYYVSSLLFTLMRLLLVALSAAEINTVSLAAVPYLYKVPSTVYCSEVERFIHQMQGDVVALSGLKFFYVTREFVLSIIGTIITYELVLLQLNGDFIGKF